ncbi:MAG: hypothetical protein LC785_12735 [Acidobacteria bacterium]|nr:hypothetical protein [Acidobacteriota bacterium]MCA1642784.1 hypothetical protein [Acidobacteriota bacterium]
MKIKEQSFTVKELDSLVMTVELTLVSIVQGVALSVLVPPSVAVVTELNYRFSPYVFCGLVVILLFWSRSLLHTFTVIRWPLEVGHNFLYVASTLIECVVFSQLASPQRWFALTAAYGASIWLLFALDLRMIRRRLAESNLPGALSLLREVEREQLLNVRLLMPSAVAFNVAAAFLIRRSPQLFVERELHVALGLVQAFCATGYLLYSVRFYQRLLPLIAAAQYEWNGEEMPKEETMNAGR